MCTWLSMSKYIKDIRDMCAILRSIISWVQVSSWKTGIVRHHSFHTNFYFIPSYFFIGQFILQFNFSLLNPYSAPKMPGSEKCGYMFCCHWFGPLKIMVVWYQCECCLMSVFPVLKKDHYLCTKSPQKCDNAWIAIPWGDLGV